MELKLSETVENVFKKLDIPIPKESDISYVYVSKKDRRKLGFLDQNRYDMLIDDTIKTHFVLDDPNNKAIIERAKSAINEWFPKIRDQGYEILTKRTYISRAGKVLRKIIPDIDEKKVQEFSMEFYEEDYEFVIRDDVTKVYSCSIDSCMQGHDMSFYEDNDVKVLTLVRGNKIEGRALLWENIDPVKRAFLDRAYVFDYNDTELFKAYAKERGWDHYYDGKELELTYELKVTEAHFYPYMDTMRYLTKSDKTLSSEDGDFCLEMTDGNLEDDNYVYSEYCGENIHIDDAVYSEYHNDSLYRRRAVFVNGDWFHENTIGDAILRVESGELRWHEDVVETVDGKLYHEDDIGDKIIEVDTEYHLKENVIKLGGNYYVKDSDDVVFCETTQKYRLNRTNKLEFKESEKKVIKEVEPEPKWSDPFHIDWNQPVVNWTEE